MKKYRRVALALSLFASGCAQYPNLLTVTAADGETDLAALLRSAGELQNDYAIGYKKSAKAADFSQIPIIGAAASAAWILLVNKPNATTIASKVAIGAGAYGATRGQLLSPTMPDMYISGYGALTCVLSEGALFSGDGADSRYANAVNENVRLAEALAALNDAIGAQPVMAPSPAENDSLNSTKSSAQTVADQARQALSNNLGDLAAFKNSTPVFRNAVSSVSVRVASKGRVRPAVDFTTLRSAFGGSPTAPTTENARSMLAAGQLAAIVAPYSVNKATALSLASDVNQRLMAVLSAMASANATMPNYRESLTRVASCPDQIR